MKLNLGYSISLPLNYNIDIPEYAIENKELIKKLSTNFNSIQIMFTKSKLSSDEIKNIKNIIKYYKNIFVHASYQINIGSELIPTQNELYNSSIDILVNEIIYAYKINSSGIILHMGKNVKKQFDNTIIYNNMVKFIIEIFNKLKNIKNIKNIKNFNYKKINIILETPAGQGGEMCYDLSQFVEFIQLFKLQPFYKNIGICIDTCHVFQAGYDINNNIIIKQIHNIFAPVKDKIKLIHLNDSFYPVGQHIDKHQQIGNGFIQINKLVKFIYPYFKIPMILETKPPYDKQIILLTKSN